MGDRHSRSPPLGPSDPFPTPAPPNYTQHLLPHLGRCSLTFSMTATTLQPLSCSRAELSVRMGRSLRLLKPCRGRREPCSGLRVSSTQPRPSQQAVGRAPAARRAVATEGRTRVQAGPTSQGQTEQRSWPWSRVARPPSQLGPHLALLPDTGSSQGFRNPLSEASSTGGRYAQGGGK